MPSLGGMDLWPAGIFVIVSCSRRACHDLEAESFYDRGSTVWPDFFLTDKTSQLRNYPTSFIYIIVSVADLAHEIVHQVQHTILSKTPFVGWGEELPKWGASEHCRPTPTVAGV